MMRFTALVALTLGLHIVLGWLWGVLGGVAAGWVWTRGGWWKAACVVCAAWAVLVFYNMLVAAKPTGELHRILGELAGGLPGWSVPIVVIFAGLLLGLTGGLVGSGMRRAIASGESEN